MKCALVILLLFATTAGAADVDAAILKGSLERCYRRCEKNHGPMPSPIPTRSPSPPTHTLGKTCDYELQSSRTITFEVGNTEPVLICHTAAQSFSPFIEFGTQNHGNASCADYWMQTYSPTGAVSTVSEGPQPGNIMVREAGRFVTAVYLRQANNRACATLTFTAR